MATTPPNNIPEATGPSRVQDDDDFNMTPAPSPTPTPAPTVSVNVGTSTQNNTAQLQATAAIAQANAQVGLAQTSIDEKVVDQQIQQTEEHWVKSYWRPMMGWLYMLINLMDFVVFPAISMFIPIAYKAFGVQLGYTAWVPLTLQNGGLIHLSFAAILGVAAYTRGQEKLASLK
jgi:hypothetical protein